MTAAVDRDDLLAAWLAGQRGLVLPASLALSDGEVLQAETALRLLPGKRLVLRGQWQGRCVLAKLFAADAGLPRRLQREIDGVRALQAAGIDTPALLWQGKTACGRAGVLLFEFLTDAVSLGQAWARADDAARQALLTQLAGRLAQLHGAGLYQADAHVDNFLLRDGRFYLIDAAGLVKQSAPLPEVLAWDNLALLLAQWPLSQALQRQPVLLQHYAQAGGSVEALPQARERLRRQWMQRVRKALRKTLRDCTAFRVRSDSKAFSSLRRELDADDWQAFLADPDAAMVGGRLLKDGNSATVVQTVLAGQPVVIKRYNVKSLGHFLRHALRRSRARRAWLGGFLLAEAGVPTPPPLALLEHRCCGLVTRAWLVTAYQGGELLEVVTPDRHAPHLPPLKALLSALAVARISHGDMKASNFLVGDDGSLKLIDLDALHWHRSERRARAALNKDWRRFLRNWADVSPASVFASLSVSGESD